MAAWQCGLCSHRYDENDESTGWDDLSLSDLCTTNSEIAGYTDIEHV